MKKNTDMERTSLMQEYHQLVVDVNQAIIKIRGAYAAWAKAHQINYHELLVLYSIRDMEVATQKKVCDSYFLPKQTVNNVVVSMKNRGYVELEAREGLGKEKAIVLTEEGRKYFDRIMEKLDECELQSVNEIGAAQLKNMIEIAERYGEILWKLQGN